MSTLTAPHMATRDEVLASRTGSLGTYTVTSDYGVYYSVLGPVPGDAERLYALSNHTGLVVLVTRTGQRDVRGKGAQVRVRVDIARDTGDANGTLAFGGGIHVGGVAPRVLFG
jgi:hypothetical protein